MKIFIDTANIDHIREVKEWGILSGVTTNPSLIAKEQGKDFKEIIKEITSLVPGPISAEVISTDAEGMVREAEELAAIADNVVIKIPLVEEGLKAVSRLSKKGIKTNVTLVFSPNQALLAARAGATFISPFVGRLDDIGHEGMELVRDIVDIISWYDLEPEVIAASIRHPRHVQEAAAAGAHIATIPYDILKKMLSHPMTDKGLEKFLKDWQGIQK
ncbi:MAG: fructose-6-phosphate aldolase [Halanaerobium sp.]|nr:fructose-6-phosphate aldolase [Halanaerobium sp.]